MDLIERYLQAVGFWLPKSSRQDITAELSEEIRSQMEEKQSELGRGLSEPEVADMLRQLGRPVFVANRYRPQRSLIGPLLFPIYAFVLKLVAVCYFVPWLLVWIVLRLSGTHDHPLAASFPHALGSLWSSAFVTFGLITLIFAVVETNQATWNSPQAWDPRQLPRLRDSHRIRRSNSLAEVVVYALVCAWWIQLPMGPEAIFAGVHIALASAWKLFFAGMLLVLIANLGLSCANLRWPYWTRTRASVRLLTDLFGSAMFCWLLKAGLLVGFSARGYSAAQNASLTQTINTWAERAFWPAVLVGLVVVAFDLYRLLGLSSIHPPVNGTVEVTH